MEEINVCAKCNSSINNQSIHKVINSGSDEFFEENSNNNNEYYSDTIDGLKASSTLDLNVADDDDDIYFSNINLIRNSFVNDEYCKCGNFSTMNSIVCESWPPARNCDVSFMPEKVCDSNLDINEKYKYSCMSENCKKCEKKRNSIGDRIRNKNEDCFISYSFENEEIFPFEEPYFQATSYKYSNSFLNSNGFKESFETEITRQSLKVCNESSDDANMTMFNNLIGNQQDGNHCDCINKPNVNRDEINIGCYLKYEDIYGNGPKLLKQVLFFFRFLLSFAKEAYSLYKKLWYYSNCNEQLSSCWPRDWLPLDCPYARVISINYTTFLWKPIWNKNCHR